MVLQGIRKGLHIRGRREIGIFLSHGKWEDLIPSFLPSSRGEGMEPKKTSSKMNPSPQCDASASFTLRLYFADAIFPWHNTDIFPAMNANEGRSNAMEIHHVYAAATSTSSANTHRIAAQTASKNPTNSAK
jgi:hypothetical protein